MQTHRVYNKNRRSLAAAVAAKKNKMEKQIEKRQRVKDKRRKCADFAASISRLKTEVCIVVQENNNSVSSVGEKAQTEKQSENTERVLPATRKTLGTERKNERNLSIVSTDDD